MSSVTLSKSGLSVFVPARSKAPSWAAQVLARVSALWTQRTRRTAAALSLPLTPFEEAEQLRAMANDLLDSDPRFAQDLYAAADRHEIEHGARL
ncbi:hypothetical protein [Hydrogenophaga sp.]|uniref:hypothetical protein n=1 Tax=Hydrogenophaga sp. TaxID=1904254 RepID=UPI003564A9AC